MTHIILFLLIAGKNASFTNFCIQEPVEYGSAKRTRTSSYQ